MTFKQLRNLVSPSGEPSPCRTAVRGDANGGRSIRLGLGVALATALVQLPPFERTAAACDLALSADDGNRLAIASALEWNFALVGAGLVIDHLASDADARVRRAAARAAWSRRTAGGDPGVLARLADDPDPEVREVAALAEPHR